MKVCSEFFLEFYWLEFKFWCSQNLMKAHTFLLLYHWLLTRMTSKSLALWPLFFRTFKLTGPFVTMIYKMLLGDLLRFGIIYVIFLTGFTQGSYCTLMPTSFLVNHFCFCCTLTQFAKNILINLVLNGDRSLKIWTV